MTLQEQLVHDMKTAMKAKDSVALGTIRFVRSAIKNREIELRRPLEEAEVLQVMTTVVKQHKDSIEQYHQGGRDDLVEKEQAELAILQTYLPQQLTEGEIRGLIAEAIEAIQAQSMKDMGKVMRHIMPNVQGRADGRLINQLVKEQLSA
jgi:uncharacterized protein YqeY